MSATVDVGMVGIGVMGGNLLLNLVDHGYTTAALARSAEKAEEFAKSVGAPGRDGRLKAAHNPTEFVALLKRPRVVILLVPAGKPVDDVIAQFTPLLASGDLLIDAGNSHFRDTDRRYRELEPRGLNFFGMGVSGGESGARYGPSLMPGGPRAAYERVRPMLEAISAKVDGDPCVGYLGAGSSGHYVKMVHNGIEYGIMQLIAESYDLLTRVTGLDAPALAETFAAWNRGELAGFLMEITAEIFRRVDEKTGRPLVEMIRDVARQKGTGQWTSQDALELRVPAPNIDWAVMMRDLSGREQVRAAAQKSLRPSVSASDSGALDKARFVESVRQALLAAQILTFSQGLALLRAASEAYEYGLNLAEVARVWRGGCIIRAALLEDIRVAYSRSAELPELAADPQIAARLADSVVGLRTVVQAAAARGIAAPGLFAALSYYDALRSERLPLNLVQAQRDFFGAHTFERIDEPGVHHARWTN